MSGHMFAALGQLVGRIAGFDVFKLQAAEQSPDFRSVGVGHQEPALQIFQGRG